MIMDLNLSLSKNQARFASLIEEKLPEFSEFWNFSKRECFISKVNDYLSYCSTQEALMIQFLASVWLRDNRFEFDFIKAIDCLDGRYLGIIQDWVADPFFP